MHGLQHRRVAGALRRSRSGFTFAEVLVALLVLAMVVFSVTGFLSWLVRSGAFARNVTAGTALAQEKLEALLASDYADVADGSDTVAGYERRWTVTLDGQLKVIRVAVRWDNALGTFREIHVKSAVAP